MAAGRPGTRPDLRRERSLLRAALDSGRPLVLVGMDEVGRGALAGPVSVGAVAVDLGTRACPRGVADSKLLTPAAREQLLPALGRWGVARAVGHAGPDEIDAHGIIGALRLAGTRALLALGIRVDVVLLDGSHDWLTAPVDLEAASDDDGEPAPRVVTRVKADRTCASVAAASVLAKCERDALMVRLAVDHPAYAWHENKGYGAPEHLAALRDLGPTALHRRSWRLPGVVSPIDGDAADGVPGGPGPGVNVPADAPDLPAPDLLGADDPLRWAMMDA